MSEPVTRSFTLISNGQDPEMDRIGVMWECLRECEYSEALRVLDYLRLRVQSQCGNLAGGIIGAALGQQQQAEQVVARQRRY